MHAIAWLARARGEAPAPAASDRATPRRDDPPAGGRGRRAASAFLGATGSMLGWGIGPRPPRVRARRAAGAHRRPAARARRVRHRADQRHPHGRPTSASASSTRGSSACARAKPDLLVVTGDIVDFDPAFAPLVARKLAGGRAARRRLRVPRQPRLLRRRRRKCSPRCAPPGVRTLVNDGRLVRPGDGGGFALLGVDDQWSPRYGGAGARPRPRARDACPRAAPRILLSHQPPTVDRWAGRVALQLSGHTHGGQINPGFRPADLFMRYVAGAYRGGGHRRSTSTAASAPWGRPPASARRPRSRESCSSRRDRAIISRESSMRARPDRAPRHRGVRPARARAAPDPAEDDEPPRTAARPTSRRRASSTRKGCAPSATRATPTPSASSAPRIAWAARRASCGTSRGAASEWTTPRPPPRAIEQYLAQRDLSAQDRAEAERELQRPPRAAVGAHGDDGPLRRRRDRRRQARRPAPRPCRSRSGPGRTRSRSATTATSPRRARSRPGSAAPSSCRSTSRARPQRA